VEQRKVLVAHNVYQQAGGEDAVFRAESGLLRRCGHVVFQYTEDNARIEGMNRLALGAETLWSRSSRKKLRKILNETQPQVAHFHNTFPLISPSAYYACRKAKVPVVQTLHNYRLICPSALFFRHNDNCTDCIHKKFAWPGIFNKCYRGSMQQTAAVAAMVGLHRLFKTWNNQVQIYIALTAFSRKKFIEGGLPEEKIMVKPNFIYPDPGKERGGRDYMLFVGRLAAEKGIMTLLRAFEYLPRIPLKVAGDGPLMQKAVDFIRLHGMQNVQMLGHRTGEQIIGLLKGAGCLVFPSLWYEGFPMTIAEAFACGVPVIASRLGAMKEIIDHQRTGLHFAPGDPQDLTAKIEWAWTRPTIMQSMGKEARWEYERNYTAEKNYEMLMGIYKTAIQGNR
jgi:glycosyltransferase involved in cell wall biosynthesis